MVSGWVDRIGSWSTLSVLTVQPNSNLNSTRIVFFRVPRIVANFVVDPGFPREGERHPQAIIWQNFAENGVKMKKCTEGVCVPSFPLDPPLNFAHRSLEIQEKLTCHRKFNARAIFSFFFLIQKKIQFNYV